MESDRTGNLGGLVAAVTAGVLLALPRPAEALRCSNRVIQDGMHEAEVIALCGEPLTARSVGYVIRAYGPPQRIIQGDGDEQSINYAYYHQEVEVRELIYNFGPRKLMRKLRFEGGVLTSIRTLGYGYLEKR